MAKEIKTFGTKGEKGIEMLNRIKTPTDQAVSGGVADILNDFVKDANAQMLGAFFGTMVTGTKMNKGTFDGMTAMIAQKNVFNKINDVLNNIYAQYTGDEKTVYGHIVKISESIKLISDNLLSYFSMIPSTETKDGKMSYNISLDTTKAENFDKILKAISEISPDNVKNIEKLFNVANQISYIDMSSLKTNFVDPLNGLKDLEYDNIVKVTEELIKSDMFLNLQDIFSSLSGISFDNKDIYTAFSALDTFTASLIKYNELDLDGLKLLPEKLELIMSIINGDNGNEANLNDLFQKLNVIGEVDPKVYEAIQGLTIASAHLLLFSDALDSETKKDIIDSIDSLEKIIDNIKKKIVFSESDAEAVKASIASLKDCSSEMSELSESFKKNGEDVSVAFSEYSSNIENAYNSAESAKAKVSQLVNSYKATNEKLQEASESTSAFNFKEISVQLHDLGSAILLMGATLLIGGYLFTKNTDLIIGSFKFAVSLAAFLAIISVPILLTNYIYERIGISQHRMTQINSYVAVMSLIIVIGGLIYKYFGNDISKNSIRFAIDLTKFLLLLSIPIVIMGMLVNKDAFKDADKIGSLVIKCTLIMIIGALFVKHTDFVKPALLFGVVLTAFLTITLLPIAIFGLIVQNVGMESIDNISSFIVKCTLVMIIGALFVGNKTLVKNALLFGAVLTLFIALVLLPVFIFAHFIENENAADVINSLSMTVISLSLVLMVGGLFMTWGNGKYGMAALAFGELLFKFTAKLLIIVALTTFFMRPIAIISLHQFTNMVKKFAIILMVGALFMMVPGFAVGAIMFGTVLVLFTALMGLVFVMISRLMKKDIEVKVFQFGQMILLLSLALILGGITTKIIGIKYIIEFAVMVGIMGVAIWGFIKAISKIDPASMIKAGFTVMMFAVAIGFLAVALFIARMAMEGFDISMIVKLGVVITMLIGVFALFMIPYLAAAVAAGSAAIIVMAIALVSLSVALAIVDYIVGGKRFVEIIEEVGELELIILELGAFFGLVGLLSIAIVPASIAVMFMSAALVAFSVAMKIVHILGASNKEYIKDLDNIKVLLDSIKWTFTVIGLLSPLIIYASIAIAFMSGAFIAFGGALNILNKLIDGQRVDALKNCATISIILVFFSGIFTAIGLLTELIIPASVAIGAMSLALSAFAGALWIVNALIGPNTKEILKHITIMSAIVAAMSILFGAIGFLTELIIGASIAIGAMSLALVAFSGAMFLTDKLIVDHPEIRENLGSIMLVIGGISAIFAAVGALYPVVILGSISLGLLSVTLLLFDAAMLGMVKVIEYAQQLDDTAIDNFGNVLKKFFDVMKNKDTLPGALEIGKLALKVAAISAFIIPLALMMSLLGNTIKDFASLRYAIHWDSHGNADQFKQLTADDMKKVGTNIGDIISTFIKALDDVYKSHSSDIDELNNVSIADILFKRPKSKLLSTIKAANMIGKCIGSLAENLKNIAKLMIPDKWDSQTGNPTHFKQMGKDEFTKAAEGIKIIIETVGNALIDFANDEKHKEWIEDFNKGEGGLFKSGSKFGAVLRMTMGMGDMISKVAQGINDYAELKVPVEWNPDGSVKEYRHIDDSDFEAASKSIQKILECMGKAIESGYDSGYNRIFKKPQKLESFFESIGNAVNLLANVAKTLQEMSELKFQKEDGTFEKINDTIIQSAAGNIQTLLEAIPNAINTAAEKMTKGDIDKLVDIMSKLKPMGEFISSLITSIQNYANLRIPTKYNEQGQAIAFKPIDLDQNLTQMAENISKIMSGMGKALAEGYNAFIQDDKSAETVEAAIKAMEPIGKVFTDIIGSIQAYADLKIPIYNGEKIVGYKTFENGKLDEYLGKVSANLVLILNGLIGAISNEEVTKLLDGIINNESYEKYYTALNSINGIINSVLNVVKNYSELKIPVGALNADGKPSGSYMTLETFDATSLKEKLKALLIAIPTAMKDVLEEFEKIDKVKNKSTLDTIIEAKDKLSPILEESSKLIEFAVNAINAYATLKIPKEYDKDGNIKSYIEMSSTNIADVKQQIYDILTAVPSAIIGVYNELTSKLDRKEINYIKRIISNDSNEIMNSIAIVIEKYNGIKDKINGIDFKKSIGKFLNEIAKMYIDMANSFKQTGVSVQDIETTYNYIMSLLNEKSLKAIDAICNNFNNYMDKVDQLMNSSQFSFVTQNINKGITEISESMEKLNSLGNPSLDPLESMLDIVCEHAMKLERKNISKFNKEASALDKFTKAVETINTSKVNGLVKLFEAMEKWSKNVGNLDEFTKAISNELSETLQKLTDEITDAKKVIKTADQQREKRQKQLDESLVKIEKLMNQTLHVNVSQQKGNTITSAWEKPND